MKLVSSVWWLLRTDNGMYLDTIGAMAKVWSGTIRFSRKAAAKQFIGTWADAAKDVRPVKVRIFTVIRKLDAERRAK